MIGLMMLLSGCGLMKLFTSEPRDVYKAQLETIPRFGCSVVKG